MKTKKLIIIFALSLFIVNCSNKKTDNVKPTNENIVEVVEKPVAEVTLYQRLGEAEGISSIVEDLMATHKKNPILQKQLNYLFEDDAHMEVVKKHLKEFLSTGTGGPKNYSGKEVPEAHKGMNITHEEFIATVDDMMIALDKNGIDEETKKDIMYILFSLKGSVIGL